MFSNDFLFIVDVDQSKVSLNTYDNRMNNLKQLRRSGLFDTNVPRYTSYPPANHFGAQDGRTHQSEWLSAVPDGSTVSLYIHIPFCKRLCWFCACRTQGTKSLRPVDAYVENLLEELRLVRSKMRPNIALTRLHLGGGTPTILSPQTMQRLLTRIFDAFDKADDFEFSVEIDPTEASDALLNMLAANGMNRASIGVQDFAPVVQEAIGRPQTFEQTAHVVNVLRGAGVKSLNMDLLYGLPHQTLPGLSDTLQKVLSLQPDRLALYGYAHVPWMSKRQVMIDADALPDGETRFALAALAHEVLVADGFEAIGIDHFARPGDTLAIAQSKGTLRRNFQGYTDDTSEVLIGLGASSISKFPQGYSQNAAATSAYVKHVLNGELAGMRGYKMTLQDSVTARMIETLMCQFTLDADALAAQFPAADDLIRAKMKTIADRFPDHFDATPVRLIVKNASRPLVRIFAHGLDAFESPDKRHSSAI